MNVIVVGRGDFFYLLVADEVEDVLFADSEKIIQTYYIE
jgi:hypothetical protein